MELYPVDIELALIIADLAMGIRIVRGANNYLYTERGSWDEAQGLLMSIEDSLTWNYERAITAYIKQWEIDYGPRPDKENQRSPQVDAKIDPSYQRVDTNQDSPINPFSTAGRRERPLGPIKKTIRRKAPLKRKTTEDPK